MRREQDPANRPTATELLAILEPSPSAGLDVDDAEELCEEYLCAICQNLVRNFWRGKNMCS
jgi:hypothetical protein